MITCQDARQLFDRYLDDELSPSLQAELHAHQLSCSACQSELAMLEACGDVVLLDRAEPKVSDSFTDRVLLARRGQLAHRPRSWGRAALFVGSPMAAAASILLAVTLIMPSASRNGETVVLGGADAGGVVAVPDVVKTALGGDKDRTAEARRELDETPRMAATGFMEELLAAGVEQTKETVTDLRSGMSGLGLLVREALTETNEQLVAEWQPAQETDPADEGALDRAVINEMDLFSPPHPAPEPTGDASSDLLLDPL